MPPRFEGLPTTSSQTVPVDAAYPPSSHVGLSWGRGQQSRGVTNMPGNRSDRASRLVRAFQGCRLELDSDAAFLHPSAAFGQGLSRPGLNPTPSRRTTQLLRGRLAPRQPVAQGDTRFPVFCVEHGRWSYSATGRFMTASDLSYSPLGWGARQRHATFPGHVLDRPSCREKGGPTPSASLSAKPQPSPKSSNRSRSGRSDRPRSSRTPTLWSSPSGRRSGRCRAAASRARARAFGTRARTWRPGPARALPLPVPIPRTSTSSSGGA